MVFIDHMLPCHVIPVDGMELREKMVGVYYVSSVQNKDKSGGLDIKLTSLVRWYWCLVIRI
jgi:hypothetical protein